MTKQCIVQPQNARLALLVLAATTVGFCLYCYMTHDCEWLKTGLFLSLIFGGQLALVLLSAPPPSPECWTRVSIAFRQWRRSRCSLGSSH